MSSLHAKSDFALNLRSHGSSRSGGLADELALDMSEAICDKLTDDPRRMEKLRGEIESSQPQGREVSVRLQSLMEYNTSSGPSASMSL